MAAQDWIKEAIVSFATGKLTVITYEEMTVQNVKEQLLLLIKKIEQGVSINLLEEEIDMRAKEKFFSQRLVRVIVCGMLFAIAKLITMEELLRVLFYLIAYAVIGWDILWQALKNILQGELFDENFLMSLATIGAFTIKQYPEAVAVMLFYQLGEYFQDKAVDKSRKAIGNLMGIRPDIAHVVEGQVIRTIAPELVQIGQEIMVKPGEKIPLDGVIIKGNSYLNMTALTGESLPKAVEIGDVVLSGSLNTSGVIIIEVKKEFGASTASKILQLVENAVEHKAETENFVTKFARIYTPIVVTIAVLLALVPTFVLPGAIFSEWLYRGLVFLVISCPCALVISIPLGFFAGLGLASKHGILVKGGNYLEALKQVDTFVFDKTGTLTKGTFAVIAVVQSSRDINSELLQLAAYGERFSNHPIARSIVAFYGKDFLEVRASNYHEIAGQGIIYNYEGLEILVGNEKLLKDAGVFLDAPVVVGAVVHVAKAGIYLGYLLIADELKKGVRQALAELKKTGVKNIVMLTGDQLSVAKSVAQEVGIDYYYGELLPQDKLEKLEELLTAKSTRGKLAFVGDGINDAPVLARADVGVAMGGIGSDAAIEAADIVLMQDDLSKLVEAIKIAKATSSIVWQNIFFVLLVKVIVLILGAIGFASMWMAIFADVGVAILAILNSVRLLKYKLG
ncbi:MAG: heavy metal translocating P-type ATPase [Clostridia bacterium]